MAAPAQAPAPVIQGESLQLAVPMHTNGAQANAAKTDERKEPCIPIRTVQINGIELIKPDHVREAVAPLLLPCLSNTMAGKIVAAINGAHATQGYLTTQGYVPAQDIRKTGTFRVNVVTGRVGRVIYREKNVDIGLSKAWNALLGSNGPWDLGRKASDVIDALDNPLDRFQLLDPKRAGDLKARLAVPVAEGDPVNLENIQQGIDQLNRAPSQKAEAKLEAGEKSGTSNIVVTVPRQDSFRLSLGYEVNGASLNSNASTSSNRIRMDIAKDNLIGINDSWAGSFAGGVNSNEVRASYSMPIRWFTFALDAGYSENLTALSASTELFSQTFTVGANTNWLLLRDKNQQTAIQAGLNWRNGQRYINSAELTPQTISFARIGLTHTRFGEDRQQVYTLGINQGLGIFDATKDPALRDFTTPRAQFFKLDGSVHHSQVFKGYGVWRLDVSGQYSPYTLYSDDQLVLGSQTSVRGFTRTPFRVDYGGLARSEFASAALFEYFARKTGPERPVLTEALSGLQLYAFADAGGGHDIANRKNVYRASLGAGLRYKQGRLSADISIAQPVWQQGLRARSDTYHPEFYLTLTAKAF